MQGEYMNVIIKKDGDCWCAHDVDFIDLQSSTAGFGVTPEEALSDYLAVAISKTCCDCSHFKQCDRDTYTCDNLFDCELVVVRPNRLCCGRFTKRC
jgi:hypothetical protein